jgi:hypothetical protein
LDFGISGLQGSKCDPQGQIQPDDFQIKMASLLPAAILVSFSSAPRMAHKISLTIDSRPYSAEVEPPLLTIHYLRDVASLTGRTSAAKLASAEPAR